MDNHNQVDFRVDLIDINVKHGFDRLYIHGEPSVIFENLLACILRKIQLYLINDSKDSCHHIVLFGHARVF